MQAKVLASFYVSFRFFFSCNIYFYMPTAMPIDKNCPREEGGGAEGVGGGGGVGKWRTDDENDSGNLWSSHKTHNQ